MVDIHDTIECLCNSPNRLRLLAALNNDRMDVRELMAELGSPRSTVQRNLSVLDEHGCIEPAASGYTSTAVGRVLYEEFAELNETVETVERIAPFFEMIDSPREIDVRTMIDARITTPEPGRPNTPTERLFDAFEGADCVYGFFPVVSCLVADLFEQRDRGIAEHEYVVPVDVFEVLDDRKPARQSDGSKRDVPVELRRYEGDIPYGLCVSENRLVLVAYDEIGRIHALVESGNEKAIKWGKRTYETYRQQSTKSKVDAPSTTHGTEPVD